MQQLPCLFLGCIAQSSSSSQLCALHSLHRMIIGQLLCDPADFGFISAMQLLYYNRSYLTIKNIARISKAVSHKLPGMSSLNVSPVLSCPVLSCPVLSCPVLSNVGIELLWKLKTNQIVRKKGKELERVSDPFCPRKVK